ncbi:type I-G CRISPR-associated protein Csb2 [Nocardiopsis baichengensis]|uniref:type I-G CRISPR-associated protein Csb2 n=1 Tax=Nocardiopsis baichengensis TaxID=280240 RepID=UPI000344F2F7|nr:type I-U CRISPR-associated protein Csb2 [Nocardiopsis baichengensis]
MALVIDARLLQGRYDAADGTGRRAEWPPHPARLFCAMVSVARSQAERDALRWLEEQDKPLVCAGAGFSVSRNTGYVVTNKTSPKGGSQHWPGRTATERTRVSALPSEDSFALVWPQAAPEARTVEVLGELAWRVPYLGRSTTPIALRVHTSAKEDPRWKVWQPAHPGTRGAVRMRAPYPGYLAALDEVFERGGRAHEVAKTFDYIQQDAPAEPAQTEEPARGAFSRMLVFSLPARTVRPDGAQLLRATQALRGTVLSRLDREAAPQITGHAEDGQGHIAYLGLIDAGHRNARGHLLGMALGLPDDLDPAALAQLQTFAQNPVRVVMGKAGHLDLTYEPWPSSPWHLVPEAWTGGHHGEREWVSATPVMLDRHPRPKADLRPHVADSLQRAGYPRPEVVETSQSPMLPGGLHRPAQGTYPPNRPRRKLVHARIRFAEPVRGPVIAGSMRYLGLGLFSPLSKKEEK